MRNLHLVDDRSEKPKPTPVAKPTHQTPKPYEFAKRMGKHEKVQGHPDDFKELKFRRPS